MLSNYLIAPSLNSLFITGLLILAIFIIIITDMNKVMKFNNYQKIMLLSIITIAIGIHGLIHLGVETAYNFNPYKWI